MELAREMVKTSGIGDRKAVHFTRGGPWFDQWREVDYADLWLAERAALKGIAF